MDPVSFRLFVLAADRLNISSGGHELGIAPAASARLARPVMGDGTSLRVATLAGAGVSLNSLRSVHRELIGGTLITVLPNLEVIDKSGLWLVYPRSNVLTAKVRVFIDFLLEKIAEAPPWR